MSDANNVLVDMRQKHKMNDVVNDDLENEINVNETKELFTSKDDEDSNTNSTLQDDVIKHKRKNSKKE